MVEKSRQEHPEPARGSMLGAVNHVLERFAHRATQWVGGNWGFASACAIVLVWGVTGPLCGYSNRWQLAINTCTTIVTFLVVFLIQRTQNKESRVIQLKLNEIVAAIEGASNRLIGAEDLSEEELEILLRHYQVLIERVKRDVSLTASHSVDEAERRHAMKHDRGQTRERKR